MISPCPSPNLGNVPVTERNSARPLTFAPESMSSAPTVFHVFVPSGTVEHVALRRSLVQEMPPETETVDTWYTKWYICWSNSLAYDLIYGNLMKLMKL